MRGQGAGRPQRPRRSLARSVRPPSVGASWAQQVEHDADDDDGQQDDLAESYGSRWWEKPSAARLPFGSLPAPNQVTPNPGQISTPVASRHRNVGRIEQIYAPVMQNGTR